MKVYAISDSLFDHPSCPEWAEYISLDKNGDIWFWDTEPTYNKRTGKWVGSEDSTSLRSSDIRLNFSDNLISRKLEFDGE